MPTQNDNMKPGAQDNTTIQLATGNVYFPVHLFSLAGRNGLDFDLAIVYNSGGLHKLVETSNLDAPTGLLGLGWSLPKEAIIRNNNSAATSPLDDVYYMLAGGNLYHCSKPHRTPKATVTSVKITTSGKFDTCAAANSGR